MSERISINNLEQSDRIIDSISGYYPHNIGKVRVPPSAVTKFGRIILDTPVVSRVLPNISRSSRDKREGEMLYIRSQQQIAEEEAIQERNRQYIKSIKLQEAMIAEQKQKEEDERSARELIDSMDAYRQDKTKRLEGERVQEASERAFNAELTKLEDIDMAAESGSEEVSKRVIQFEGQELTVYDMRGFPFSFLQHAIDFKGQGEQINAWLIGASVAKSLQDNPSLWAMKEDTIKSYGGNLNSSESNTISTSYVNTEENARTMHVNGLYYGFDHVRPDSILQTGRSDIGSTNGIGKNNTYLSKTDPYTPRKLERAGDTSPYNEVQIRRYDESGNPQLPDFVIIKDNKPSDVILKHAAYFNIPVINIETEYYDDKEAKKLIAIIDGIDGESSYEDIKLSLDKLDSSYLTSHHIERTVVGLWDKHPLGERHYHGDNSELASKIEQFSEFELAKRVDFIKKRLQEETDEINLETSLNEEYFAYNHGMGNIENRTYDETRWVGDAMHRLDIEIQIQPDRPYIRTEFYDGDNPSPQHPKPYSGANSEYYNELAPLFDIYLEALRKNKENSESVRLGNRVDRSVS